MKRAILVCFVAGIFAYIISCNKSTDGSSCVGVSPDQDSTALLQFAGMHGITAMHDSSGIYYQVLSSGYGPEITDTTTIRVMYTGKLMNGTIYDSVGDPGTQPYPLNQYIEGWRIGLPKIKKGGHILLLIPSALAFGCRGSLDGKVPANSPLYFDVSVYIQ